MPRRRSAHEVEGLLLKLGFEFVRQRGSHRRYRGTLGGRTRNVTVVARQDPVPPGTLRAIVEQLGVTHAEFDRLLDS
jgi:predicted RNA binding protein YcfA (HicA-like mRNA interferase family)